MDQIRHKAPKRRLPLVAGLALVATAVVVAAVIVPPRLVENRILAALADAGVRRPELTVESVGWRQASIVDVRIGGGLTIAAITARYTPGDVIDGRLRELTIEGLVLRGAVTGDGVAFAALEPFLGDGDGDDAWAIPLDAIVLRECRVELATPLGDVAIAAEGIVHVIEDRDLDGLLDITVAAAPAALAGRLTFAASAAEGYDAQLEITEAILGASPPLAGEFAAALEDGRLAVDGALYSPDGALALTVGVTIADITQRERRFDLDAELWVADPPALNRASLSRGRMAVTLSGVIPDSADMAGLALSGALEMDLDDVTLPGVGDGLSLSGAVTVETFGGVVTVASQGGLRFEARHLEMPEPADALALDLKPLRVELRPGPDGVVIDGTATGRLSLRGIGAVAADLAGRLELDADGVPWRFDLRRLTATASDLNLGGVAFAVDGLRLSLAGTPDAFSGDARVTLSSESFAGAGIFLTQPRLILKTAFAYGSDGLSLTLGEGASLDAASLAVAGLAPLAFHVETAGESTVAVAMAAVPPSLAATIELPALRLTGVLGDGTIAADLAGRLELDVDGVPRRFDLRRLTVSASDLNLGGVAFAVDELRLSLAGTPDAFTGDARVTLLSEIVTGAGVSLTQPRFSMKTTLAYGGDGLTLTLGEGASLDAASLAVAGLALPAFHVETVGEATVAVDRDGRIRHDLRLALPAMEVVSPSLTATVELPALRLAGVFGEGYDGTMEIAGGALRLPGHDLALDGIDASLELDGGELHGGFTVRALRHPAVASLAVTGSFDLTDGAIGFSGRLTGGDGALAVTVEGRHRLAAGTGGASVEVARLAFDPAKLRPGDLAPGLRGLASEVRGTIAATGRLAWGGDGLTSEATLLVEDLSLDAGDLRLERVNSVIAFDSLWPPSTPPAQRVAIGLIDAGLPLTDGIVDFQLRPDGVLYVENAVWRWAGGRLKTQGFLFDPNAERHAFTIEVDDLDLAEIVALADMEDLSASGRLSGRAPVTVTAEGFAIIEGRLETGKNGGLLRYAPRAAPAALRQGGEGATLAMTLLENFSYESLRIDIDRDAGGDAEIAIHLRGSNADVYDGYPIEFNLNISGPIDRMLRRGLEGYRVPDTIAERLQGFGGE